MHKKDRELEELRAQVESADMAILESLSKRMKAVLAIGAYKRAHGLAVFDARRKKELKKTWISAGKAMGLPRQFVAGLFERVHAYSLSVEKKRGV